MRRLKELTEKERLDGQTSYLTFLPPMSDGFHTGYHTTPGVVTDHSKRPGEWLEALARNMRTNGQDVGYSIPDVLACEQQLRRLSRMEADEGRSSQQMTDYRAVLATLLLWDTWAHDETSPVLEAVCLSDGQTAFASSVAAALTPRRAPDGLWVFTLRSARDTEAAVSPIALLSHAMVIIPAANPGDLSAILPPCVRWYDRADGRFTDPCLTISQRDAFVLVSRLRILQQLKEQSRWQSPLQKADEQLICLLDRFAIDLLRIHGSWHKQLLTGDEQAVRSLRLRALAAATPHGILPIERQSVRPAAYDLSQNPLLAALTPAGAPACTAEEMTLYTFDGAAFACSCHETLLKPADQLTESGVLKRLSTELGLLEKHHTAWRAQTADALRNIRAASASGTGFVTAIAGWLEQWADELNAVPAAATCEITLEYPLPDCPVALRSLLGESLGLTDDAIIQNAFSDALLLWEGEPAYDDAFLASRCYVKGIGTAVPPLSPALCQWLMERFEAEGDDAAVFDPAFLCFEASGDQLTASFRLLRRAQGERPASAIAFRRSYRRHAQVRFETGSAVVMPATQRPGVTVWPNARFAPGLWKSYAVFTQHPGMFSTWVYGTKGWQQGKRYTNAASSWQTVCSDTYPAFTVFKRGELSFGALINDQPRRLLKREPAAAIAIDFGSISTTVMMRQDDKVQPASLPECMHRTLLAPGCGSDLMTSAFLPEDVLLPGGEREATFYSVMDMFTDEPERWNAVLEDGHIYYRSTLEALAQKNASALYYDLKWSDEPYAQRVMRLFLKQVMVQASLSARLWGSDSVSWRVSMPNAMPLHKQESYLELMRGLAREVAKETGLPLTPGCPAVLYATENQADGLYFLSRSEINARSGYLNLDIGGSTADLSLWLGGAKHASIETSLLMGCRQMLFLSLLERHANDLDHDFEGMDAGLEEAIHQVTAAFRAEGSTTRGQRKCMLLLDDLLASRAPAIRECMAKTRAAGRISYLESLLLWQIGFLFYLAGEVLERAWQDSYLRMMLPMRMELCIAGNGGQLVKAFDEEQQNRLCSFTLARLSSKHPLQILLPIQSRHPKQEVARGLLCSDESLHSTIQGIDRNNGTRPGEKSSGNLLLDYLPLFYHVFPQATNRLMPNAYDESSGGVAATARMELDTIYANELLRESGDDLASYVDCFHALKRLWNI